ncbi:hypothetical protein Tco_0230840 [Tanacetum coccineum]
MQRCQKLDAVVVRDFYKKFYNSLGRVPNRCSSSIGKTRGLLSFSRGIGWEVPVALAIFAYECAKLYKKSKKRKSTENPKSVCEGLVGIIMLHTLIPELFINSEETSAIDTSKVAKASNKDFSADIEDGYVESNREEEQSCSHLLYHQNCYKAILQTMNKKVEMDGSKPSATKQALPNTTDAEVGKPEVAKEVGGRKSLRRSLRVESIRIIRSTLRAFFYPTGFRTGQYWERLLRALEASNKPGRNFDQKFTHLTKGAHWRASPKRMPPLHSAFRRIWRTKVPFGAKGMGDSKTKQKPMFSLNCLWRNSTTQLRSEDAPTLFVSTIELAGLFGAWDAVMKDEVGKRGSSFTAMFRDKDFPMA